MNLQKNRLLVIALINILTFHNTRMAPCQYVAGIFILELIAFVIISISSLIIFLLAVPVFLLCVPILLPAIFTLLILTEYKKDIERRIHENETRGLPASV